MINNNVLHNIDVIILPLLDQYRHGADDEKLTMLNSLEDSFKSITSTFGRSMSSIEFKMSPREIEICNFIRSGLTSKEIASQLRLAFNTIETHRTRIRKKLKIEGKRISLVSFLRNLA